MACLNFSFVLLDAIRADMTYLGHEVDEFSEWSYIIFTMNSKYMLWGPVYSRIYQDEREEEYDLHESSTWT